MKYWCILGFKRIMSNTWDLCYRDWDIYSYMPNFLNVSFNWIMWHFWDMLYWLMISQGTQVRLRLYYNGKGLKELRRCWVFLDWQVIIDSLWKAFKGYLGHELNWLGTMFPLSNLMLVRLASKNWRGTWLQHWFWYYLLR